jgi:hypothetical protein
VIRVIIVIAMINTDQDGLDEKDEQDDASEYLTRYKCNTVDLEIGCII